MFVFGSILWLIADYLARVLDVRPPVIIVGHPVEDVEADGWVGVDAALDDLDDVALADEDVVARRGSGSVAFDLSDADADTGQAFAMGIDAGE